MPERSSIVSRSKSPNVNATSKHPRLTFYPAYCYKASPTWFVWVKLTAHDIHHRLQTRHDFQPAPTVSGTSNGWKQDPGPLLFYLNHPIQFVQLVGVVVTFEDYFEKFWLFTIDDSSGSTIEINCPKPVKDTETEKVRETRSREKNASEDARFETMQKVDIGIAVQVKGQVTTFRDVRQLRLERIVVLKSTNHEMKLVAARAEFAERVLSTPWQVAVNEQDTLRQEARGEDSLENARLRKRQKLNQNRVAREKKHANQIAKQYEFEERQRVEETAKIRMAGELLKSKG